MLLGDLVFYIILIRYIRLTVVTWTVIVLVGSTIIDGLINEELTLFPLDLLVICACSTVQVGLAGTVMLQRDPLLRPGTIVVELNMLTLHILFGLLLLRQLSRQILFFPIVILICRQINGFELRWLEFDIFLADFVRFQRTYFNLYLGFLN